MSLSNRPSALPASPAELGWHALRCHRAVAVGFLTAGLTHAASHGTVAWIAGSLGRTIAGSPFDGRGFAESSPTLLACMGLFAVLIKGAAGIVTTLAQTRLSGAAGQYLRELTIRTLLDHGTRTPAPTVVARFVSRIREAETAVHQGVFATARAVAQLLPIVVALWLLAPALTAVALLVLAPFGLLLARARKRWRVAHHTCMQAADTLYEETDDIVRHVDLWRTYGSGLRAQQTIIRLGAAMIQARVRSETTASALSATNEVLAALALVLALATAAYWPRALDGGRFIAFATVFVRCATSATLALGGSKARKLSQRSRRSPPPRRRPGQSRLRLPSYRPRTSTCVACACRNAPPRSPAGSNPDACSRCVAPQAPAKPPCCAPCLASNRRRKVMCVSRIGF
ncbi:MAG: hypothetical protein MUF54_22410 [Polyangiaceae bacterium]|nr:hypothetical protein [Polyangiaceae bacterium]